MCNNYISINCKRGGQIEGALDVICTFSLVKYINLAQYV